MEEGEEEGAEELLPHLMFGTHHLAGAGCHPSTWFLPEVSKSSCHKQLTEFAFQVGKPGINKSNAKGCVQTHVAAACYSNILLPVSSPTESILFLWCLLLCKHYRDYCCQKPSLTSPHTSFSFLPPGCPLLCAGTHIQETAG